MSNLVVISHSYINFIKYPVERLSPYFDHIYVFVRLNSLTELSNLIPVNSLKIHTKKSRIDLSQKPENITVIPTPFVYLPLKSEYDRISELHYKSIAREIEKNNIKFDIIHSHFTYTAGYAGAKLKSLSKKPMILTVHEDKRWFMDEYYSNNENIIYAWKTADMLCRVNKGDIPLLKKYNNNTCHLINCFNENIYRPLDKQNCREKLKMDSDKKIIFSLGYLVAQKGFDTLIDAMELLVRRNEDIICYIGGDGPLKNELRNHLAKKGLQNHVILIGYIPTDMVSLWMNACDLFVVSSKSESFGITQIEAMACGKPIVATINGGSEEIITSDDLGFLVNHSDPYELAKKISEALDITWDNKKIINYASIYNSNTSTKNLIKIYQQYVNI